MSLTSSRGDARETFENIYFDLGKKPGRCRMVESGIGWKAAGDENATTIDNDTIAGAQWSRASRGYEVKIYTKDNQVIQLDGFQEEVIGCHLCCRAMANGCRISIAW